MGAASLDLPSLSILVVVVLVSCILATLLSWCWVRSTTPRTFLYCSTCVQQMGVWSDPQAVVTDGGEARPWVEVAQAGGFPRDPHIHGYEHSGTFQRLGMKLGTGLLKVEQLETRPLSPVPGEEDNDDIVRNSQAKRGEQKPIMSPTSADVLARKDSVRSRVLGSRMSRRTLEFPTQSHKSMLSQQNSRNKSQTGPIRDTLDKSSSLNSLPLDIDTDNFDHDDANINVQRIVSGCNDTRQRQVRRSVSERKEKSRYMLIKRQEAGFTSQSEDDIGARKPRQTRRYQTGNVDSEALREATVKQQVDGSGGYSEYPNPRREKVSVIRSSVASAPQELQQFSSNVSPVNPGYENLPSIQFPPPTEMGPLRE